MGKVIEYKEDRRIQGLVEARKADFVECIHYKCPHLMTCSKQKVSEISCVFEKPLVQFSASKFDLKTETKNAIKAFFERLKLRALMPNTFHNATNQTFLDNIAKYLADESTPDLSAQYVAFSTEFSVPTKNSSLINEIGRVAPSSVSRAGAVVTVDASFGLTDANTLSTTIKASPTPTASQFDVNDVTGLQVGDRVQVTLGGTRKVQTKVDSIATLTVTVDPPLDTAPTGGEVFEQMISRVQLVAGSATTTLNSGDPVSIASYIDTKASTQTLDVTFTISFV